MDTEGLRLFVIAAETLRASSSDAEIVLVGNEHEPPYSRMAIPYLLVGQIEEAGTYLRQTAAHFDELAIAEELTGHAPLGAER